MAGLVSFLALTDLPPRRISGSFGGRARRCGVPQSEWPQASLQLAAAMTLPLDAGRGVLSERTLGKSPDAASEPSFFPRDPWMLGCREIVGAPWVVPRTPMHSHYDRCG